MSASKTERKPGDLQVWWIPHVNRTAIFEVDVASVEEGVKIMDVLADYDLFQLNNRIKPDSVNAGGLCRWCEDLDGNGTPGWGDWCDEETGNDDPWQFLEEKSNSTA